MSLKDKVLGAKAAAAGAEAQPAAGPARPKPGLAETIAGEQSSFKSNLLPFLPSELIGGSIPQIPGMEEEAVWNAAAQASGTERVNYCYSIDSGRCWYLAIPSTALASQP